MKQLIILVVIGIFVYHNFFRTSEDVDIEGVYIPEKTVIVAFGDSLTYGTGAGKGQSYPEQLSKMINIPVIKSGVPGEITEEGLARLPKVLDTYKPNVLLLCHGGNDILQHRDLDKTKENIEKMILMAQARGVTVILIAVPEWSGLLIDAADFYGEIAKELIVPLEDKSLEIIMNDTALKRGRVHPNNHGYRLMAEKIRNVLYANYP